MAGNIAEKLTINDVKMKLFHTKETIENLESSPKNENEMNSLENRIAIPSTSRQGAIYAKKKSPIKRTKKGKAQIISILHLPSHPNKHIPIILKKSKLRVRTEKFFNELLKSGQEKLNQSEDSNVNEGANNKLFVREQLMIENAEDIPKENDQQIIPFKGNVEKSDLKDFINNKEVQGLNICTDEYYAVQGKLPPNDNNMLVPYKGENQQSDNNFEVSKFVKIKHFVSILKGSNQDIEEMETSNSVSSNDLVINEETSNDAATVEQGPSFISELDDNVVTVASEDIPYNAEIEIGDDENDSLIIEEVLELNENKIEEIITEGEVQAEEVGARKVAEENVEASPFDQLKANSERRLFLEKEDPAFCRAAQRKIHSIPDYGYRGFKAIHKFHYILSLIPDESPATVHALMVAFKNKVAPVLMHLRYIQQCRKVLKALTEEPLETVKNETPSTSSAKNTKQAKSSVSTRKKKISYDMDLSDNYADDSDEDYVPGKDLTPKRKKKRSKKKHCPKNKGKMTVFRECPVHKALFETQENEGRDEGASTSTNILANISTVSSNFPIENANGDDAVMVQEKENKKKRAAGIFAKSEMLYKSEPIGKESLELTKFKKKRPPHSYIVPPVQKYMYAHEPVANYRFLALTKQ